MRNVKIKIETCDDNGNEVVVEIPGKRIVCGRCDGTGTHVNPSIDGHGIGAEEWDRDWDDDSREGYFNGRYDVTCEECKGERVVVVADQERCTEAQLKAYGDHLDSQRPCPIQEMERRMGA